MSGCAVHDVEPLGGSSEVGLDADLERIQHDAAVGIGGDVRDAWIEDETDIANALTNAMFASLVVTIWSEMEHFLKALIEEYQARLGQPLRAAFGSNRS